MSVWLQNIIVIAAVGACAAFMLRSAYRALHGRKSKLSGCGACSGCATTEAKPKASPDRIVMVPLDSLVRTGRQRPTAKSQQ